LFNDNPNPYPYQERVLYNIQFPRKPDGLAAQWDRVDIGLNNFVRERNYGIRPADDLFVNDQTGESRAPDLLLFETRVGLANKATDPIITIEYNLPATADVTITLLNGQNQEIGTLVDGETQQPAFGAFNVVQRTFSGQIGNDYGYRLFVRTSGGAEGEYVRDIRVIGAGRTAFLPLVSQGAVAATQTAQPGMPVTLNATPGSISTMGPLPSGIISRFNPPLPGQTAIFTNAWQDEVDDIWASAYAGAYTQNGEQGLIYVLRWQSWEGGILTDPLPGGLFVSPVQGGALTITAYNGGVLNLETEDGQTLFFDVRSLEFVPE
jgi:hypothetical protein